MLDCMIGDKTPLESEDLSMDSFKCGGRVTDLATANLGVRRRRVFIRSLLCPLPSCISYGMSSVCSDTPPDGEDSVLGDTSW